MYGGDGIVRVRYIYDSWGNTLSVQDANGKEITDPNHMGNLNPMRYRGYYFDTETGLYYLQSRYYDPQTCRFVNADTTDILQAKGDLYDKNLFAYCDNNPVARVDDGGELWNFIAGACIGAISVYVGDVIENVTSGKTGWDIFTPTSSIGTYLGAAVSGMIPGAGFGSMIGRVAVNTAVKNVTDSVTSQESITLKQVGSDLFNGLVGETLSLGTNKALDNFRPKNYSTFRHKITQKKPQISQQQTRETMQRINRSITRTKKIVSFSVGIAYNVFTNRVFIN